MPSRVIWLSGPMNCCRALIPLSSWMKGRSISRYSDGESMGGPYFFLIAITMRFLQSYGFLF